MTERVGRDDSLLYSGATSASFARPKVQELVQAKREEAKKKRQVLKPAGEILVAEINKELNDLMFGPYVDEDKMTDDEFRVERRARRLTVEKINAIKGRLTNILRDNKLI